jgi:hypothetical protein
MRIAVLLRGFHFIEKDRFGFPMNGVDYLESFFINVINPLKNENEVKLYTATYPSPISEAILAKLNPHGNIYLDPQVCNQRKTLLEGLKLVVKDFPECERLICTRFDLDYVGPIDKWNIWKNCEGVFLPWREYELLWMDHHRVGDAIHVVDKVHFDDFSSAVSLDIDSGDMHKLHDALIARTKNVYFIEEGFYDSNTLYGNVECRNPIYKIGNRPRLFIGQPHLLGKNSELRAEMTLIVTGFAAELYRVKKDIKTEFHNYGVRGVTWCGIAFAKAVFGYAKRALFLGRRFCKVKLMSALK